MSNVSQIAPYAVLGNWFQKVAAELGKTPTQLFLDNDGPELDLPQLVKSYAIGEGTLTAALRGDATLSVSFNPATLTVTQVLVEAGGATLALWQGEMSAHQFLNDDWPAGVVYGTSEADWYCSESGETFYAGSGNDLIEVCGGIAYGQAGDDTFVVWEKGGVIADYQPGDKIVFGDYESLSALAADFVGATTSGNGFTLHFVKPYGMSWTLTVENTALSAIRMEDIAFGAKATLMGVYQPLLSAFGIDPAVTFG